MFFSYNDVSHVLKDHQKKMGDLIINPKLSQPEFEAAVIELKKLTAQRLKDEKYKGVPTWKIAANWILPIVIVFVLAYLKRIVQSH